MRIPKLLAAWALLVATAFEEASGAQLGDINGDGRVSLGDAFLLQMWLQSRNVELEPAAGSLAAVGAVVSSNS